MVRRGIKSSDYSRLEGVDDNGDKNGDHILSQLFSYSSKRGRKFWLVVAAMVILLVAAILLSIHFNERTKNFLKTSSPSLKMETGDVHLLYKRNWPIPDCSTPKLMKKDKINPSNKKEPPKHFLDKITMEEALEASRAAQKGRVEQEQKMAKEGYIILDGNSAAAKHHQFFKSSPKSEKLATDGFSMDQASQFIAKKLELSKEEASRGMEMEETDSSTNFPCVSVQNRTKVRCQKIDQNFYRGVDGFCNNLKYPQWGSVNQPYRRILRPDYADGISAPRVSTDGSPLPHPRKVSTILHYDRHRNDSVASLMLPAIGQFLDHEISAIVLGGGIAQKTLSCCKGVMATPNVHPECFPFPQSDEIEGTQEGAKCVNFWRSAAFPNCEFGPRNQFSATTPFIDGSIIYGSTESVAKKLRDVDRKNPPRGYMATHGAPDERRLLPVSTDLLDGCNRENETEVGRFCFTSGDPRVNENLALTAVHLLWVRQHNKVADQLAALNPVNGHPDRIYFETREIIIAQLQHVIFNEYLPLLLGHRLTQVAGLGLLTEGYYDGYNDTVNPTISNVFAAAAYRMGHSMIQGLVPLLDGSHNVMEMVPLHELLFDPFRLWTAGNFDAILRGYALTPAAQIDTFVTTELTRHLFQKQNEPHLGLDLVSLNIQRGRDHGIPGYTSWRKACGLQPVQDFPDLMDIWDEDVVFLARDLYKSVHDIELYSGMLAELHLPGAMVGPTVGCLLADQFLRLRQGDRFWYEGSSRSRPFTPGQLQEIRKTTLARLICDNGDDIQKIQTRVLEQPSAKNTIVPCTSHLVPTLDYRHWQENVEEIIPNSS